MKNKELKITPLWLTFIIHIIPVFAGILELILLICCRLIPQITILFRDFIVCSLLFNFFSISAVICGIPALFIDIRNLKINITAEGIVLLVVNVLSIIGAAFISCMYVLSIVHF